MKIFNLNFFIDLVRVISIRDNYANTATLTMTTFFQLILLMIIAVIKFQLQCLFLNHCYNFHTSNKISF